MKVNNRKVLDGVMEAIGLGGEENADRRLTVLRAIDKLDRLKWEGVSALLGAGRKDESGDFTTGAGLSESQIAAIKRYFELDQVWSLAEHPTLKSSADLSHSQKSISALQAERFADELQHPKWPGRYFSNEAVLDNFEAAVGISQIGREGVNELREIIELVKAAGYGSKRIRINPSVVRGLEYYTSAVFEVEMADLQVFDDEAEGRKLVRFGSVGGGGRYDELVGRFRNENVPATGFSIGVSRLRSALRAIAGPSAIESEDKKFGPVVVAVFDKERLADYQRMVSSLRCAGIRAELYLGNPKGFGNQFKYAAKRGSPCVVI